MKQNIYDNEVFKKEYNEHRTVNKGITANDLIEIPTIRKMFPEIQNKSILDLGCGYGENCKYFSEKGANYVLGTDISTSMISIARENNNDENIEYEIMAMEDISKINKKFDLIVSSLAIHYIKDFDKLCKDVYNLLNENGYFVFSQEHPIGTGTNLNSECNGKDKIMLGDKLYYLVSDYNRTGERNVFWNNCYVTKYHRNISEIVNTLIKYFEIVEFVEPLPTPEMLEKNPKYINQYDKPFFLFVKVKKIN